MKPEDLIESLEWIGDDLLANTERTMEVRKRRGERSLPSRAQNSDPSVNVRKSRSWIGAAAAAVLMLAIGFGGFALWRYLKPTPGPASNVPGTVIMPSPGETEGTEPEPVNDGPSILEWVSVSGNWEGVSLRRFDDVDAAMEANPWRSGTFDSLPVFRNLACQADDPAPQFYTEEQLSELLARAAGQFGVTITRTQTDYIAKKDSTAVPEEAPSMLAVTDQGTLYASGDGSVIFFYDEAHWIAADPAFYTVEGPEGLSEEEREALERPRIIQSWMDQLAPILQMPEYGIAAHSVHEAFESSYDVWTVYPLRNDPWEQFLSYSFEQVQLLTVDGVRLAGIGLSQLPPEDGFRKEDGWNQPAFLESLGGYPLIPPAKAKQYLKAGDFLTEADRSLFSDSGLLFNEKNAVLQRITDSGQDTFYFDSFSVNAEPNSTEARGREESAVIYSYQYRVEPYMELVYLTETSHELLIPFYRFWVPAGDSAPSGTYAAAYVPAIRRCHDFPQNWTTVVDDGSEPETDSVGSEPPEPTLPEDPELQTELPILSLESGFRCLYGDEIVTLEDVEANLAVSPWRKDPGRPITALTVFRNLAYHDEEGVAQYYDEENLRFRVENLAAALHLSILSSDLGYVTVERDGKTVTLPAQLTAKTDFGTIVITGDGKTDICFDEPQSIDRFVSLHFGPGEHVDLPEYRDESALDFAQAWITYLLNLDGRLIQRADEHSSIELRQSTLENPDKEGSDPSAGEPDAQSRKPRSFRWWRHNLDEEAPLQYTFGGIITLDENGMLTVFTMDADANEEIGDYPIISPEEADEMLREGRYLSTVRMGLLPDGCLGGQNLLNRVVRKELVYRTSAIEEIFLPFYRYWIPLESSEAHDGGTAYCAFYVPAVREEYLTDWPSELTPAELYFYRSTLTELRDWFSGPERQALLGVGEGQHIELDSWVPGPEEDVIQLRYWRGGDKMIPWSANLRRTEEGWEVLSNAPSEWNVSP